MTQPALIHCDPFDGFDDAFGHWLAGFIDGEGCFVIAKTKNQRGNSFSARFALRVREDDRQILEQIITATGLGRLTRLVPKTDKLKGANPQVVWQITSRRGCHLLIVLLERYPLRAKKGTDIPVS